MTGRGFFARLSITLTISLISIVTACHMAMAAPTVIPWLKSEAQLTYLVKIIEGGKTYEMTSKSTFENVRISNTDDGSSIYEAHVMVDTNVIMPDGGRLDNIPTHEYDLSVRDGRATVKNFRVGLGGNTSGGANADTGSGLAPFFAYTGADLVEGKIYPAQSSQVTNTVRNFGGGGDATIKIDTKYSERKVGRRETIKTGLGDLSCWPVTYSVTIKSEPTPVTDHGNSNDVTLALKEHTTRIKEWFSPKYNLVIKSESDDSSGITSTMEVMRIN